MYFFLSHFLIKLSYFFFLLYFKWTSIKKRFLSIDGKVLLKFIYNKNLIIFICVEILDKFVENCKLLPKIFLINSLVKIFLKFSSNKKL